MNTFSSNNPDIGGYFYVEPIRGVRTFYITLDEDGNPVLNSPIYHAKWKPGIAIESDIPPEKENDNGIYAVKEDWARNIRYYTAEPFVIARVSLWGKIVVHEDGYRAQYAYPYEVKVPDGFVWFNKYSSKEMARKLANIYKVDAYTSWDIPFKFGLPKNLESENKEIITIGEYTLVDKGGALLNPLVDLHVGDLFLMRGDQVRAKVMVFFEDDKRVWMIHDIEVSDKDAVRVLRIMFDQLGRNYEIAWSRNSRSGLSNKKEVIYKSLGNKLEINDPEDFVAVDKVLREYYSTPNYYLMDRDEFYELSGSTFWKRYELIQSEEKDEYGLNLWVLSEIRYLPDRILLSEQDFENILREISEWEKQYYRILPQIKNVLIYKTKIENSSLRNFLDIIDQISKEKGSHILDLLAYSLDLQ